MGDQGETQVDEHLDPEDEIAFENAAPDEDDSGDAGSDYGSDDDYDDDKVRRDGRARAKNRRAGWVVGGIEGIRHRVIPGSLVSSRTTTGELTLRFLNSKPTARGGLKSERRGEGLTMRGFNFDFFSRRVGTFEFSGRQGGGKGGAGTLEGAQATADGGTRTGS